MSDDKLPDSGERRSFGTGAVRDVTTGKGRFDLVSPIALKRLAIHLQKGAEKYSDRNWELGIKLSSFIDSCVRHIYAYVEGDRSEDHMAAAMWNIMAFIHTEECIERGVLPNSLHDLVCYLEEEV